MKYKFILKKYRYLLLFFFLIANLEAEQNVLNPESEKRTLNLAKGIMVFDYQVISLPNNNSIDLFGTHYLHQLNDWFYLGIGASAPLVKGNYGGFMTLDATAHVQYKIFDNIYLNTGVALGGGGGGSSVEQSKELSGTGGFVKGYFGAGYEISDDISLGLNYTYLKFEDSQIDSAQLNVFLQVALTHESSPYSYYSKMVKPKYKPSDTGDTMLSIEMNNLYQINPTAKNKDLINTVALQMAHFVKRNTYLYLEIEVGYKGMPLYNHIIHGVGQKVALSSRMNLYAQLGVGSGGYSPDNIDTGAGLLIYPKVSVEYALNEKIGVALSGGYLYAPLGTSKNYTYGLAMNYHLANKSTNKKSFILDSIKYKGFRIDLFNQTEFNVKINNKDFHNINLVSTQFNNLIDDNWYIATQVSIAYNDFKGFPGYGELLVGGGIQSKYETSSRFQNFFQVMIGTNSDGIIAKPTIGTNYTINDRYALYGQIGKTLSLHKLGLYEKGASFSAYNMGIGLTYRFTMH